jgi:hypothetical protein
MTCCIVIQDHRFADRQISRMRLAGVTHGYDLPNWLFSLRRSVGAVTVLGVGSAASHQGLLDVLETTGAADRVLRKQRDINKYASSWQQVGAFHFNGSHATASHEPGSPTTQEGSFLLRPKAGGYASVTILANSMSSSTLPNIKNALESAGSRDDLMMSALTAAVDSGDMRGPITTAAYAELDSTSLARGKGVAYASGGGHQVLRALHQQNPSDWTPSNKWPGWREAAKTRTLSREMHEAIAERDFERATRTWEELHSEIPDEIRDNLDAMYALALIACDRTTEAKAVLDNLDRGFAQFLMAGMDEVIVLADKYGQPLAPEPVTHQFTRTLIDRLHAPNNAREELSHDLGIEL